MADPDADFETSRSDARDLLDAGSLTAFYVGVVRDGERLDAASSYRGDDPGEEGMQALSLLASHLRIVAEEADVDYETVARDAAALAERVDAE